jgi:hypothetical protein
MHSRAGHKRSLLTSCGTGKQFARLRLLNIHPCPLFFRSFVSHFQQRFAISGVESAMNQSGNTSLLQGAKAADILPAFSMVIAALMAILFLVGCETTRTDQADSNSMIQKEDDNSHVHGQVDAMYGFGR